MEFKDIYSETDESAAIKLGDQKLTGKLTVKGSVDYGDFCYDGLLGTLKLGMKFMQTALIAGNGKTSEAPESVQESKIVRHPATNTGAGVLKDPKVVPVVPTKQSLLVDTKTSTVTIGGSSDGSLNVKNGQSADMIILSSSDAKVCIGNTGASGNLVIKSSAGKEAITLNADSALLKLGGVGTNGDIVLKNIAGNTTIDANGATGNLTVGGTNCSGHITLKNTYDIETIKIDGLSGDIEFMNADFAEEFDIHEPVIDQVTPGMVMILDDQSRLIPCNKAYDPKVVGVIAGAGKYRPGVVMDKSGNPNRLPIAMVGKVYCMVDANICPIQVGDMLTTSKNEGHAMKASDKGEAFGSVIGKALSSLTGGTALIPVLVNLQ